MDTARDRLIGIELLRFAAAFGVLIWHYQNFLIGAPGHPAVIMEAQPLYALVGPLYVHGASGVRLIGSRYFQVKIKPEMHQNNRTPDAP